MGLNLDVVGLEHKYSRTFVVGREKIREFAKAIKCECPVSQDLEAAAELGYDRLMAPITFAAVMALLVQKEFFRVQDFGVDTMQIVQTDQRFVFHQPLKEGDELSCWFVVETHKESFGVDIVTSRNVVRNQDGEMVMEAFTTLMGRDSEAMADIKISL